MRRAGGKGIVGIRHGHLESGHVVPYETVVSNGLLVHRITLNRLFHGCFTTFTLRVRTPSAVEVSETISNCVPRGSEERTMRPELSREIIVLIGSSAPT